VFGWLKHGVKKISEKNTETEF